MCAAAAATCLDSLARRDDWRGGGDHHAWHDMQGGKWQEEPYKSGEMMHGVVEMA